MNDPLNNLIISMPVTPISLADFRKEFLGIYPNAAKGTLNKLVYVLKLIEALGVASTDQLTPELIGRFIASRPPGQSPHTTKGLLMNVRTICSYAEARRYVAISPFRVKKFSRWVRAGKPQAKRHNTPEEIRAVFDLMRSDCREKEGWAQWRARRLYGLTATAAYTGLRAKEAQLLHVEDLDLDRGLINLVPRTPTGLLKTDASAQPVCAPAALIPLLRDWLGHRLDHPVGFRMPPAGAIPWLWPGSMRRGPWRSGPPGCRPLLRLKAVALRAGVADMTFQSLRRSWATIAEARGVPQAMITRQCRHTSEETTRKWYQQRDLDSLRDAVEGFDI